MGGECYLEVNKEGLKDMDMDAYHALLREFKKHFVDTQGITFITDNKQSQIKFNEENPTDKVFAEMSSPSLHIIVLDMKVEDVEAGSYIGTPLLK